MAQEEAKVRQVVEDYYLSMRTMFTAFYQEAHARENNSTVLFGDYQINDHVGKIVEYLGKIEEIQIRFTGEERKEERRDERKENRNQQN